MPLFNTSAYVGRAVQSVLDQSFRDFELIVIDDGSTDDSAQIVAEFAARDGRIRLTRRENRGLIRTRNELLQLAAGELLAWMDSDDLSLPGRLAEQVEEFDRRPGLACLGSAAQWIDPADVPLGFERHPPGHAEIRREQQHGSGMRFPTVMLRKVIVARAGGFREPFRIGEDLDFLLRVGEIGEMANLPQVLYRYRQHVSSTSRMLGGAWSNYLEAIQALAAERAAEGSDRLQRGLPLSIALPAEDEPVPAWAVYATWAVPAAQAGFWRAGLKYAVWSVALNPRRRKPWLALRAVLAAIFAREGRAEAPR